MKVRDHVEGTVRRTLARAGVAACVAGAMVMAPAAAWAQAPVPVSGAGASAFKAGIVAVHPGDTATRLDEHWKQALWSVMDGMRKSARAERTAALRALAAEDGAADDAVDAGPVVVPLERRTRLFPGQPSAGALRLPPGGLRDAIADSPWEFTPVTIEPATESPVDTRGEYGILLGATLHLPWLIP